MSEDRSNHPDPKIDPTVKELIERFFMYNDIADQENQHHYEKSIEEQFPRIRQYAESLRSIIDSKEFVKTVNKIRSDYDVLIMELGLEDEDTSRSQSWIYWDLAKQSYFATHLDEADERYLIDDPLRNEEIRQQIIDRHLGWEAYTACSDFKDKTRLYIEPPFLRKLDARDPTYEILSYLKREPTSSVDSKRQLSSLDLTRLGNLIRTNIEGNRKRKWEDARGCP